PPDISFEQLERLSEQMLIAISGVLHNDPAVTEPTPESEPISFDRLTALLITMSDLVEQTLDHLEALMYAETAKEFVDFFAGSLDNHEGIRNLFSTARPLQSIELPIQQWIAHAPAVYTAVVAAIPEPPSVVGTETELVDFLAVNLDHHEGIHNLFS